ncbi:hypothetical protein DL93DRAFT_1513011 [Clavulina sp. PMI_390]|nr:hypothetical protein DL93DRAFT_1513011 [Clavulina sp. PMI_390]
MMHHEAITYQQNPAVNLPPELLSTVFLYALRNYGHICPQHISPAEISSMRRARLNISAVCVRWREVALSTQVLWSIATFPPLVSTSQLSFNASTRDASSSEAANDIDGVSRFVMSIFDDEVSRAGNCTLSLHIIDLNPLRALGRSPIPIPPSLTEKCFRIIEELLPHCKHLEVTGDTKLIHRLLCLPGPTHSPLPCPALQSLSVSTWPDHGARHMSSVLDLSWAKHLRELKLTNHVYKQRLGLKISSEAVLQRLEAVNMLLQDIMTVLAQSPHLEELYWESSDHDVAVPQTPVHMPCVIHLILYGPNMPYLLRTLDAPQLERLEIHSPWGSVDNFLPSPPPKPCQFPRLRVFILFMPLMLFDSSESAFGRFIQVHSNLQVIRLQHGWIAGSFIESLSALPSLRHVSTQYRSLHEDIGPMALLQAWYAKASLGPADSPLPTLYVRGGTLSKKIQLLEPSEFSEFARNVVVSSPLIASGLRGAEYWDEIFHALDRGEGLRRFINA